jgi:hypothetical protein
VLEDRTAKLRAHRLAWMLMVLVPAFGWLGTGVAHATAPACTVTGDLSFNEYVALSCSDIPAGVVEVDVNLPQNAGGRYTCAYVFDSTYAALPGTVSYGSVPYTGGGSTMGGPGSDGAIGYGRGDTYLNSACNAYGDSTVGDFVMVDADTNVIASGAATVTDTYTPPETTTTTTGGGGGGPDDPMVVALASAQDTTSGYVEQGVTVVATLLLLGLGVGVLIRYLRRAARSS